MPVGHIFFYSEDENDFQYYNKGISATVFRTMKEDEKDIDQSILNEILDAIQKLKYGEVVITVHNSKIVQIEKKEKKRFG